MAVAGEVLRLAAKADETAAAAVRFGDDGEEDIGEEAEPRRWRIGAGDVCGETICGDGEEESSRMLRGGGGGDGDEPLWSAPPPRR